MVEVCDTHVFGAYKAFIKEAFRNALLDNDARKLDVVCVMRICIIAVRHVLQGTHWGPAFAADGYSFG